jgi:hypothetical protein
MKPKISLLILVLGAAMAAPEMRAQDIDSMPPVVVKTFPEAGSTNVSPSEVELKVVFSKPMADKSWSVVDAWNHSTPAAADQPAYDADQKTWTMKVKLEAGKTYGYWLNSQKFKNFKDANGRPAVPYLLVFKTKDSL